MSALHTTMPSQKEVLGELWEPGVRRRCLVMMGGGPVSRQWAEQFGADRYADTATEAVELAARLVT